MVTLLIYRHFMISFQNAPKIDEPIDVAALKMMKLNEVRLDKQYFGIITLNLMNVSHLLL